MKVNAKGQIIADEGLKWFRYLDDRHMWWTRGIGRGSGFRIEHYEGKRWHLYRVGDPKIRFDGSVKDCMRVAEMYLAVRGL